MRPGFDSLGLRPLLGNLEMADNVRQRKIKRSVSERWTSELAKDGWTPISDFFLENYATLRPPVSSLEAMLVIQLMKHKWDSSRPYPGFSVLAKRMGLSAASVRAHARNLEKHGYLKRIIRVGQTNEFDLTPLFHALERHRTSKKSGPPKDRDRTGSAPTSDA